MNSSIRKVIAISVISLILIAVISVLAVRLNETSPNDGFDGAWTEFRSNPDNERIATLIEASSKVKLEIVLDDFVYPDWSVTVRGQERLKALAESFQFSTNFTEYRTRSTRGPFRGFILSLRGRKGKTVQLRIRDRQAVEVRFTRFGRQVDYTADIKNGKKIYDFAVELLKRELSDTDS